MTRAEEALENWHGYNCGPKAVDGESRSAHVHILLHRKIAGAVEYHPFDAVAISHSTLGQH